jgi:hypothetical protein
MLLPRARDNHNRGCNKEINKRGEQSIPAGTTNGPGKSEPEFSLDEYRDQRQAEDGPGQTEEIANGRSRGEPVAGDGVSQDCSSRHQEARQSPTRGGVAFLGDGDGDHRAEFHREPEEEQAGGREEGGNDGGPKVGPEPMLPPA